MTELTRAQKIITLKEQIRRFVYYLIIFGIYITILGVSILILTQKT